ncbi:MAG TPA: hypothetical protein DEB36_03230 [Porphyromonadaceae bacterium]|jgi:hypothetical protein|nr:hypothetical protein [Porphyromonadaceae bacterium]
MKKSEFVFFLLLIAAVFDTDEVKAQEYKHESGGMLGISFYLGDANKTRLYLHPGFTGGILYRYNINFHWAAKANLLAGKVSGNTRDANNVFPLTQQTSFNRTFIDWGGQIEFNFLPFSDKFTYKDAKPYTPYVFAGAGVTFATGSKPFFNTNVSVGIGFKYKIKERLNIGLEFSVRKLFGDGFDAAEKNADWGLDAPYGIKSSIFKNQDWYSLTMIFLTWDFGIRHDPCCE